MDVLKYEILRTMISGREKRFLSYVVSVMFFLIVTSCFFNNEAYTKLFEKNNKDWFASGGANWDFDTNELVGVSKGDAGFVMTKKQYKDFILQLESKPDSTINSGIFIRCKNKELSMVECYENNIWDLHPNQENRTGSVVNRALPKAHIETIGKWNTYKIKIEKNHLQTWVNDILTTDITNNDLVEGLIGLQAAEEGEIRFRNIKIMSLESKHN